LKKTRYSLKNLIKISLITLLLCGCAPKYDPHTLQGTISQGAYSHPDNLFHFTIPKMIGEDNYSLVLISDDCGGLVRVEVIDLQIEKKDGVKILQNDEIEEFYKLIFDNCILRPIQHVFPKTQILEESYRELDQIGKVYLVTINIKGFTVNKDNGERTDSKFAYVVSICENLFVIESMQEAGLLRMDLPPEHNQELYDTLIELRKSFNSLLHCQN
jgi:hypothetical protein